MNPPPASADVTPIDLAPIYPPVPVAEFPWMLAFLAAGVLALLAGAAWWFWRRPKPAPEPPDPRVLALRALRECARAAETVDPYPFSIRVSDILRGYITEATGLPATRQTTPEFLRAAAKRADFTPKAREVLASFLAACDAIKFAGERPPAETNRGMTDQALRYVEGPLR